MMGNEIRRSQRGKVEENNNNNGNNNNSKTKKKAATPDASPASGSRRSTRGLKETPVKENVVNTRKSERLEKMKPVSGTTPVKEKAEKKREQIVTTPVRKYDTRKNEKVSPAMSNMKSEKAKIVNGSKKRKRLSACLKRSLIKSLPERTEEGDEDDDKESEEEMVSEANSSSSGCREVEKPDSSNSVEDKDDSVHDCSDDNEEESTVKDSEIQSKASDQKDSSNERVIDQEQDRTPCEADAVAEIVEKNNGVSRTDTKICIACKKLRCYHLPLVIESIWDTRVVEVSEAQGLHEQKQYWVKYKGLAHIHNQWIMESEVLLEAPLLVESYNKNGSMKWNEEWTVPHQLLKKRLLLSLEPVCENQDDTAKVLKYHYEWLVQWQGLDSEQATWESEDKPILDSPEGHKLIEEYEKYHGNAKKQASSDNERVGEIQVELPTALAGCSSGVDNNNIHLSYVKNLHDAWTRAHTSIIFDDQERTTRIVLFILSLKSVYQPFLLITRSDSLSQWEAMFSKIAHLNAFKVSLENTHEKASSKLLHVRKESCQLAFQLLLYPVDAFVKDLNVLKAIKWEAVIVDESQCSDISSHFSSIKTLSADKRLLVNSGLLGVSNLDVLPLFDFGVITQTELDDSSKLKEALSKLIAYECKSSTSKFVEYWVPVQMSDVQLEQYCSMLLSNLMALGAFSKSDTFGALHEILVSNRKCCDHPYIVDQSLQAVLNKDLEPVKYLDVGIKASGKLQFLDLILPEMRKRQLRVLIVFQPLSGTGKDSASIGDILDDFVRQRFGVDSYERVDGFGMLPSKKQAALNNFNNKEMGRFIFLLESKACSASIKLSSVDTIILFGSDWNPANDLKALQKIAIDSPSEQIMTFRLYTSLTLEEKILRLAEHNVTVDSKLQNISRSTSGELLMWGATHLFKRLDEFHSDLNTSSEECWLNELMEEFLDILFFKFNNKDAGKLKITRAKQSCGKNVAFPNEVDREQPHTFWRKLLVGRNPCWKYLPRSTPRQRTIKRPQYFEESPTKTSGNSDDVGRKRKKVANNIAEPVSSKPVIEEGDNTYSVINSSASKPVIEGGNTNNIAKPVASKPVIEDEMSFLDLLKLKISKLCEVLKLPEDVKIMVERFLEYVIENYRVNKEPENTLHAFLISLCWIGSGLLKHKLDRKQSISLANEHLGFSCKEDEANIVCLKLELAKEMFLLHTGNQMKTFVSTDATTEGNIGISDSQSNHNDDGGGGGDVNRYQKDGEVGTMNSDTSNALEDQNKDNAVQPSVSPAGGQSVQTGLVNESNLEASPLQPNEEPPCLPSENQSNIHLHLGEQQPYSEDHPVVESSAQVPNLGGTTRESNQLNGEHSGNSNQGAPQKKPYDPLQAEFDRLCELRNTVVNFHEAIRLKIKSEHEKELEKVTAQINAKYEAKYQEADSKFQFRKKEVETYCNRVLMNKVLAEAYRSKCQDLSPISPTEFQGGRQHPPPFQGQRPSNGVYHLSSSQAQSSASHQVQPPLQIVNQSSKLFSTPPSRPPPSNTDPSTRPPSSSTNPSTRPPTSNTNPSTAPPQSSTNPSTRPATSNTNPSTAPPPSSTNPSTRPPPSNTNPSIRPPPSTVVPTNTPNRPSFTAGIPSRPPPSIHPTILSSRPINPIHATSRSIRPPPFMIPVPPPARNLRISEIRATPPHLRTFRLPTSSSPHGPRGTPSHHPSSGSPVSQTSVQPVPLQTPPTNHNTHPTQTSPRSSPLTSSQPASFPLPSLHSWHQPGTLPATPSSQPQTSLPPMPSVAISHTGLYNPPADIDTDEQGGSHPPNAQSSPPPSEVLESTDTGKESGGSDLVCLSDDDD